MGLVITLQVRGVDGQLSSLVAHNILKWGIYTLSFPELYFSSDFVLGGCIIFILLLLQCIHVWQDTRKKSTDVYLVNFSN